MIHVYYGEGGGKTTTALGLALRAVGHGYKVIIIQFMKGRKDIGEYRIRSRLGKDYEIFQFGRKEFINTKKPLKEDYELSQKGMEFVRKALTKKPKLLVLDELGLAAHYGLVKTSDVIEILKSAPKSVNIVITGRYIPKKLIDFSDLATRMQDVKHPFKEGVKARKGIEY